MVRHTQTIRQQQRTNCLSVFDRFVVMALKVLSTVKKINEIKKTPNHSLVLLIEPFLVNVPIL